MLAFQIQDDKKQILEKNLKRNSKMMILGIDDHGHRLCYPKCYKMHVNNFVFSYEIYIKKFNVVRIRTKKRERIKLSWQYFTTIVF